MQIRFKSDMTTIAYDMADRGAHYVGSLWHPNQGVSSLLNGYQNIFAQQNTRNIFIRDIPSMGRYDAFKVAELKAELRKRNARLTGKEKDLIKRWVMKKMNVEFAEMLQTTTGKLLDQITVSVMPADGLAIKVPGHLQVRDFTLGTTFPIIKNVTFEGASIKDEGQKFDELTLVLDLIYHGGFQLAVDVDLVFGKAAYLSVKITHLKGQARLQFSRLPFTHWSFTFLEDPVLEFDVESHFDGRQVPQITSLIVNQIRRTIRKKHTLPNYKIRYRPFFIKPEPKPPPQDIFYHGSKLSVGHMEVTVLDCSRLVKVGSDTSIYCTLAIDSVPWTKLMSSKRKLWVAHEIDVNKEHAQNIGFSFREEFFHERYEEMVVVDYITAGTPAENSDIRRNDVLVAVNGTKVTSSKQAVKLMKQANDRFSVRIERCTPLKMQTQPEFKFEEDTVSLKDVDGEGSIGDPTEATEEEEYINISVPPTDNGSASERSSSRDRLSLVSNMSDNRSNSSSPKKGFSGILSSSSQLFHRKRTRGDSATSKDSLEFTAKYEKDDDGGKTALVTPTTGGNVRRRSREEKPAVVKEKQQSWEKVDVVSMGTESSLGAAADDLDADVIDLRKTAYVKATQEPVFNEKFDFDLEEGHNYLNVCVWCNVPEKLDKQSRVIKPEKDVLLGHVSIPLMDISLQCLATVQGDMQHSYKLTPPEIKANASRAKVSNLSAHSGFDDRLCYGDITLAFEHQTQPLTNADRRRVHKISQENENRQEKELIENGGVPAARRSVSGRKHDFVGTHFQSGTYCNFCHKKIWLKTAFRCNVCAMICHKKCMEKCQAQAMCAKGGMRKPKSHSLPPDASPTVSRKAAAKEEKEALLSKASFFGKFRKESPKLPHKEDIGGVDHKAIRRRSLSPEPTHERRRHNSAPNEENGLEDLDVIGPDGLLTVNNVPRTRSSTSLQDLIQENANPTLQPNEVYGGQPQDGDVSSSSESDDEVSLLRFFEKQKSGHNADEMVVTAAKEMGKELYAHLSPEQRREKLDTMVSKLQSEIDVESENRADLARQERVTVKPERKAALRDKLHQSDEKIQSLALLMLHYCAGLQHCLDTMEEEKELHGNTEDGVVNAEGSASSRDASPCSRHSGSHSRSSSSDLRDVVKNVHLPGGSHSCNNSGDMKDQSKAPSSDSGTHSRDSSWGKKDMDSMVQGEPHKASSSGPSGESLEPKGTIRHVSPSGFVIKVTSDDELGEKIPEEGDQSLVKEGESENEAHENEYDNKGGFSYSVVDSF